MMTLRSLRAHGVAWLTAGVIALALGAGVSAQTPERPAPASRPEASDAPPAATAAPQPPPAATDELQAEEEGFRRRRLYARPAVRIGEGESGRKQEQDEQQDAMHGNLRIGSRGSRGRMRAV